MNIRANGQKSHCFKHASTHPASEGCPYCARQRLVDALVRDHISRQWPHANKVTHPHLMQELECQLRESTI